MKAERLKVNTGGGTWLVTFDEDTRLDGAESMNKIGAGKEIHVTFEEETDGLYASSVRVKKPASIDPEKQISVDELSALVDQGPETGNFALFDARPVKLYTQGHIPGAISHHDVNLTAISTNFLLTKIHC